MVLELLVFKNWYCSSITYTRGRGLSNNTLGENCGANFDTLLIIASGGRSYLAIPYYKSIWSRGYSTSTIAFLLSIRGASGRYSTARYSSLNWCLIVHRILLWFEKFCYETSLLSRIIQLFLVRVEVTISQLILKLLCVWLKIFSIDHKLHRVHCCRYPIRHWLLILLKRFGFLFPLSYQILHLLCLLVYCAREFNLIVIPFGIWGLPILFMIKNCSH